MARAIPDIGRQGLYPAGTILVHYCVKCMTTDMFRRGFLSSQRLSYVVAGLVLAFAIVEANTAYAWDLLIDWLVK